MRMIPFTSDGYKKLQEKQAELTKKREEVVVRLQAAREMGDLSENGAYKAARFELSDTDRELRRLAYLLKDGQVISPRHDGIVGLGNTVTVKNDAGKVFSYLIVGTYEADPLKGKVSVESPMGMGLQGKRINEIVEVREKRFTITRVS